MAKKKKLNAHLDESGSLEKYNIKGKVWQVKQSCYQVIPKRNARMDCKFDAYKYKRNSLYTFNEKGIVIEKEYYDFRDGIYIEKFNEQGKHIITTHSALTGNITANYKKEYDKNGFLHKHVTYGTDNELKSTTVFINDEKGAHIEYYQLMPDGTKQGRQTFINDEDGKKIDQTIYNKEGKFERRMLYKYDEYGHTIETKTLNEDGSVQKIETNTFLYDSEGNLTVMNGKKLKHDRKEKMYRFEYDRYHNWLRRIEYYKGIPTEIYVREINYFGDEAKEKFKLGIIGVSNFFIVEGSAASGLQEVIDEEEDDDDNENRYDHETADVVLTNEQWQWIDDGSKPGDFNARRYFISAFGGFPSETGFGMEHIEVRAMRKLLKERMEAFELFYNGGDYPYESERPATFAMGFPGQPYIVYISNVVYEDKHDFDCSEYVEKFNMSYRYIYTAEPVLFRPSNASGKRDIDFEYELENNIRLCSVDPVPDAPEIYMVQVNGGNYQLQTHPVNDNFDIRDLNVNYGSGFNKFHDDLMKRFESETKGLVLFHGQPGTGKTYYIRHLLRTMASKKKKVIYMPPNMIDYMVEPAFMTFLTRTITEHSSRGIFCVLLIEDAEPLLAKRQEGVRIQGITNLLNMTDGLLNDMLKLQIICTFNVDLRKLDSALLRPGRLIARKEFKPLSELDANLLAQRLGIKHHFKVPATLGEIYAKRADSGTLIHDVEHDKGASSNIDDLL
jgi:hypothetical protein